MGEGGYVFFFKQKTAYEIVSRDWSSDVCSSDLRENSGLRIIQHVNTQGSEGSIEFCMKWYLTFNNQTCSNPDTIQHLEYSDVEKKVRRGSDSKSCLKL